MTKTINKKNTIMIGPNGQLIYVSKDDNEMLNKKISDLIE